MILAMDRLRFRVPMQVRTTRRMKAVLDHVLADVRGAGVEFQGEPITQEALINASFLWFEELGADQVVAAMRRHVPRMEAVMRGEDAPADAPKNGARDATSESAFTDQAAKAAKKSGRKA